MTGAAEEGLMAEEEKRVEKVGGGRGGRGEAEDEEERDERR